MAKIIFNKKVNLNTEKKLEKKFSSGYIDEKQLFKKRSKKYFEALNNIDNDLLTDTNKIDKLIEQIQNELEIPGITEMPLGIISKCFLGHPYEVHTLDMTGNIIRHYKINEKMEPLFEPHRSLALHHAYAVIEIYKDKILLVQEDGSIVKM